MCEPYTHPEIIRHIVCSGGGVTGFSFYGILKECYARGIWKVENIKTIYGTSVGSIFAVLNQTPMAECF